MVALMYDGLQLGKFVEQEDGTLRLIIDDNIEKAWLPYIFEIHLDTDMNKVISTWIKERVFPKNRLDSFRMLRELGLFRYDINKIARITRCSVITDPYWIAFEESDTYTKNSARGKVGPEIYPYNSMSLKNEEDFVWRI